MMRFISILLLIPYCVVSLMGHAGFDVAGLHKLRHGECEHSAGLHVGHKHHDYFCNHSVNYQKTSADTDNQSQNKNDRQNECPDDCTVCQFFSLLNAQSTASAAFCVTAFINPDTKVLAEQDTLVAFCLTPCQGPRAPPVSLV